MIPGYGSVFSMIVGPGEEFDDPGCAHFADEFQAVLDFPGFYFVGETGVNAEDRVVGLDGLLGAGGD